MAALGRTPSRHFGSSAGERFTCQKATLFGETAADLKEEEALESMNLTVDCAAIQWVCQVDHCHEAKAACAVPRSSNGRHECRYMSSDAGQHRQISAVLQLLSQMADLFLPDSSASQQGAGHSLDIRQDADFWALVQTAMVRPSLRHRLLNACFLEKRGSAKICLLHHRCAPGWQARARCRTVV